jgi:hypothetical protein
MPLKGNFLRNPGKDKVIEDGGQKQKKSSSREQDKKEYDDNE